MTSSLHDSGSYLLIIRLDEACRLKIGALGEIAFDPGYFVYVGSAKRGLRARIARHLRDEKKIRWHIDYLLTLARVERVLVSNSAAEQELGTALLDSPDFNVINHFGSSDSPLPGHLFHCPEAGSSNALLKALPSKVRSVTDEYPPVVA